MAKTAAHRSDEPDRAVARPSRATRGLQVAVVAMQTVGAVLTIATWLHSAGLL